MATDSDGPPWPAFVDALSTVLMMMVFFTLLMVLVTGTLSYIVALKEVTPGAAASTEHMETMIAASQDLAFMERPSAVDRLDEALGSQVMLGRDDLVGIAPAPGVSLEELERKNKELMARVTQAEKSARSAAGELEKLKGGEDDDTAKKLQAALEKIARLEAAGSDERKLENKEEYTPPEFVTKLVKGVSAKHRIIILYNQLTSTLDEGTRAELLAWIKENREVIEQQGLMMAASLNHRGVSSSMANSVSFKRLYGLINTVTNKGGVSKKDIRFRALSDAVPGTNQVVISIGGKP
jgi:hypothetical protein